MKKRGSSVSFFTMKHAIFLNLVILKVDLTDTETVHELILDKLC